MPQPPDIAAKTYFLFDVSANQVLAEREPDLVTEPASLTKLMTAYLVFQALKDQKLSLDQTLTVSERAWRTGMTGASRSFIDVNSQVRVEDLIKGMIVQSGNDATVALAEGIGGSVEQFVEMMNQQAKAFGLKNTSFRNPEGLPAPGHQSTARDLAIISTRLIQDFPQDLKYYSMRDFTFNRIKQPNRNLLLYRDPSVDGLKTGYTDAAGYCLIATAKRDLPGGTRRLVSVMLGAASMEGRANESQKLLNWGYTAFDAVKLFDASQEIATPPIWKSSLKTAKLGSTHAVMITLPKGMADKLKTDIVRPDPLIAPLAKGQQVGTAKVSLPNGKVVSEIPLVSLEDVPEAGFFSRMVDTLHLMWLNR
jgi:D-alanyl-D-alanine carboxypeptidase (penicillin-binding protein 5/6)